jgi:uncharacterized protein with HEPN domain
MSWATGGIKKSYDGDLWKRLEDLQHQLHNPQYCELHMMLIPKIVHELASLTNLVKIIKKQIEPYSLTKGHSSYQECIDQMITQSLLYSKDYFQFRYCFFTQAFSAYFADRRYIEKMHNLINLDFIQEAAAVIGSNQASQEVLVYKYALFRLLEVLGESAVEISTYTKNLTAGEIAWESLRILRNDLVHVNEDHELEQRIEQILQHDPTLSKLLHNILLKEFDVIGSSLQLAHEQLTHKLHNSTPSELMGHMRACVFSNDKPVNEKSSNLTKLCKFIGHLHNKGSVTHISAAKLYSEIRHIKAIVNHLDLDPDAIKLALEYAVSKAGEISTHIQRDHQFIKTLHTEQINLLEKLIRIREHLMHKLDHDIVIDELAQELITEFL